MEKVIDMSFVQMVIAALRGHRAECWYSEHYGSRIVIAGGVDRPAITVDDGEVRYLPDELASSVDRIGDDAPSGAGATHANSVVEHALSVIACARWVRRVGRHYPIGNLAGAHSPSAAEVLLGVERLIEAWRFIAAAESYAAGRTALDTPGECAVAAPWTAAA